LSKELTRREPENPAAWYWYAELLAQTRPHDKVRILEVLQRAVDLNEKREPSKRIEQEALNALRKRVEEQNRAEVFVH